MKPNILLIEPMMPEVEAHLDAAYRVHRLCQASDPAKLIAEFGPSIRAIVTGRAHGASNEVVDALPALENIAINGIGTDAVDLERARSVRVTSTPDVLTDDVADLAMGLMLAVSRRICVADRFVRAGRWPGAHLPRSAKVSGKRLGIFGLGHVGRAVARRAEGFEMPIAYSEPHPRPMSVTASYRCSKIWPGIRIFSSWRRLAGRRRAASSTCRCLMCWAPLAS
jgi:lactate dehydrogenase-like 2-hydroxyacid dehydrogenase